MKIMAKEPYFPFYYRDFLVSTGEMTDAEVGKYLRYLIHQWEKGSIPSDPSMIQTIRFDSNLWETLKSKFPLCEDRRRRNPRLEEIRVERDQYVAKQSEAGRTGAQARWGSKRTATANATANSKPDGKQHGKTIASTSTSTSNTPPRRKEEEPLNYYEQRVETYFTSKIDNGMIGAWKEAHPKIDVPAEILKAKAWLFSNQGRKQYKQFGKFLGNWMANAANPPPWMVDKGEGKSVKERIEDLESQTKEG